MDLTYLLLLLGLYATAFGLVPVLGQLMDSNPEERK